MGDEFSVQVPRRDTKRSRQMDHCDRVVGGEQLVNGADNGLVRTP